MGPTSDIIVDSIDLSGFKALLYYQRALLSFALATDAIPTSIPQTESNIKRVLLNLDDSLKMTGSATYGFTGSSDGTEISGTVKVKRFVSR